MASIASVMIAVGCGADGTEPDEPTARATAPPTDEWEELPPEEPEAGGELRLPRQGCHQQGEEIRLGGQPDCRPPDETIRDYCLYGAHSEAEFDGCLENVTLLEADGAESSAGDYARGVLNDCLDDAGPLCQPR